MIKEVIPLFPMFVQKAFLVGLFSYLAEEGGGGYYWRFALAAISLQRFVATKFLFISNFSCVVLKKLPWGKTKGTTLKKTWLMKRLCKTEHVLDKKGLITVNLCHA